MRAAVLEKESGERYYKKLLEFKEQQIHSLLQITQAINNNMSARGLMKLFEDILVKQLGIRKFALFISNINWMCTNAHGIDRHEAETLTLHHVLSFKQITHLRRAPHELARYFDVVVPVYHKESPLAFTFLGGLDENQGTIEEQLNYIQTISSIIAVAIENKKLFRSQVRQRFLKTELEMAGQMQTMLIPGKLPDNERVSFAGVYLPHEEVGGDYYDYMELNNHECIFCIADISGKGMAAALLMASFQSSVRSYAEKVRSLDVMVERLNTRVNEITKGEKFITLFLAKYNYLTRELEYVNAGHNPALLLHDGEVRLLQEGCTILGMFDELPYINVQKMILPGEFQVFCYTDGLIDLQNPGLEALDIPHLSEFLIANQHMSPSQLNKAMVDFLVDYKGGRKIADDISLLTCKVYADSGSR
ncbi:MAG: serine/threonine-protein phosphatase [Chitinophagales bacterium]|nr:serine/threonine-protein phosphatase [Bacteroidota bacterium]MBX7141064.1 serine/threonine-protein phosphatase [Chitinophagales bacterium]